MWVKSSKLSPPSKSAVTTPLLHATKTTPVSEPVSDNPRRSSSAMDPPPGSPAPTPVGPEAILQARDTFLGILPFKDVLNLSSVNGTFRKAFFDPDIVDSTKLASRVVWNNSSEVEKILEAAKENKENPNKLTLLLQNTVIIPAKLPSGHRFKGYTPFQAALCTLNTKLCEIFKRYFEKIPDGLNKMQEQINKIFPNGIEAHIEKQKKAALEFKENILRPLITVISDDNTSIDDVNTMLKNKQADSGVGKAIAAFRKSIRELSVNNKEDPVSNQFYLQEAFNLYVELFNTFKNFTKCDLFCIQVIGLIQCYSPAADLQAFTQSVYELGHERKPLRGGFKFASAPHSMLAECYLEINMEDFRGLGFNYFAASCGESVVLAQFIGNGEGTKEHFQFFYQVKTEDFINFVRGLQPSVASPVMPYSGR